MADETAIIDRPIVSIGEARTKGLLQYFTGKPCPKGHVAPRNVRSRGCLRCLADAEKKRRLEKPEAYKHRYRSYQDRNPERVKASNRAWKDRNRERASEAQRLRNEKTRLRDPKYFWSISALCAAKRRSRTVGAPYNLTREHLLTIAGDLCPALGIQLIYAAKTGGGAADCSATIDRIDPGLGYVIGNVAVISHRANSIKRDASLEELRKIVSWLELLG